MDSPGETEKDFGPDGAEREDAGDPAPDAIDAGVTPDSGDGAEPAAADALAATVERIPAADFPAAEAEPPAAADDPHAKAATREPQTETAADPLVRDIEAILFISTEPVSLDVLAEVTGVDGDELALAVETVREKFSGPDSGIIFTQLAGGYTFRSSDGALPSVERFCQRPVDYTLSAAAMETLAIVAYLQPITRPEIARIRGISADTVVANLLDKGLLEEGGRSRQTGAVKYRTTSSFEKLFGLADISELPAVEGFDATPADVEELRQKLHLAADKRE